MKKTISIFLCMLLAFGLATSSFAAGASDNTVSMGGNGGARGLTPPTQYVLVRYGHQGASAASLSSGDPVVWDTTSADGITISACVTSFDPAFAGILIEDILTAENSFVRKGSRNWGQMAIRGFCLASMEVGSTAGQLLYPSNVSTTGTPALSTADEAITGGLQPVSQDMGVLLKAPASAGALAPIYLK